MIQNRCGFLVWREGKKRRSGQWPWDRNVRMSWEATHGLSCGSWSCPEQSLQRNSPKDAAWGNSDPQHIPGPGPTAQLDGSGAQTCRDRENPDPWDAAGCPGSPLFPCSVARPDSAVLLLSLGCCAIMEFSGT